MDPRLLCFTEQWAKNSAKWGYSTCPQIFILTAPDIPRINMRCKGTFIMLAEKIFILVAL
jgi:hypothetical protein